MDLPFLMLVLMLVGIGLIMMFSASFASAYYDSSQNVQNNPMFYIRRQAAYAAAGLLVMYVTSKINYQRFRWMSVFVLVGAIALLVLVLTPIGVEINQVKRWLYLFLVAGPTFQPSEIAKVAVVLFFAARLSKRDTERKKKFTNRTLTGRTLNRLERIGFLELVPYGAVLSLVLVLVVMEPHMSGTILIMVGAAAVLFASGINLGWFVGLGSFAVAALTFVVFATDYMTRKINLWLDPWSDPQGAGYQPIQSLYAIGSGGLLGLGLGKSRQKFLYIPEPENDFIFSIVVEELGFIGAAIVLILFALLIMRGYWLALHARDKFGTLTIVGIITLLAAQVFLNIGVVTNLIPNTGISLPFFSYGGTALMIQLAEMGIILSISRQIPAPKKD
ncbi:putative lipid II flippase FtsW [Lawsonibacter sp. OA9]|uniref:Probable peptidoglycan glycosyltransferase FtsW n=2 Tax=Clostridia TaxID=186801 RepID=A0A8J6J6F9_9FIRM|nr:MULTISPECIES: putative peptidoglycan glycosyltransferase FtsW [Eubacteriales]MBC5721481.1 cell division protein FtsW [Flintibacter hominis]MBS5590354.1 cell division protein FtsW [Clostridiales bacterium]MCH1980259.1 putative lipid II flippase FtsW [Lawsonibacter sp. OA9]MCU6702586.1 putative lipid II flippase FtsW [Muriventricola aceti]